MGTTVTATATCPAGKKILGGGGSYTVSNASQANRVGLIASYPSAANAWTVTARVHQGLSSGFTTTVTTYAVCTV
jgi:maltoporin